MISCGLTPRNILLALMCCHAEFGGSGEMSPPVESLIENFVPLDTYPIGVRLQNLITSTFCNYMFNGV